MLPPGCNGAGESNVDYTCTSANRQDGGSGYLASPSRVTSCVYGNEQSRWKRGRFPSSEVLTSCGAENAPGKPINSLKECVAAWKERGVEVTSSVELSETDLPMGCSLATAEGSDKRYAGRVSYNTYSGRGDGVRTHTWGFKLLCDCTGNSPAHRKIPLSWCSVQYGRPDAVTCSTFETETIGACGFSPAVRMHRHVYHKPKGSNDFGSRMSPQLGNVMCYKANPVTLAPTSSPTTVEPTIGTPPPTIAPTEWPWATNFTLQSSGMNTCSVGQIDITVSQEQGTNQSSVS